MVFLISGGICAALVILGLGFCLWHTHRKARLYRRINHRLCRKMHALALAREAVRKDAILRSAFFSGTSHEIRTPLNGILSMINVLQDTDLTRDQRTYTEVMRESCCELLAMLNDVLDLARISAGKLSFEAVPFDLASLVERASLLMRPRAGEKGLRLEMEVSEAVAGHYLGDPGRIRQILYNLIGNAIKFTEAGFIRIRVSAPAGEGVRFEVTDSGCGIAPEKKSLLFLQFSQLGTSVSRTHGGSGLGLSICKYLTERMGGTIGCDSRPGEGATFWFTLPLPRTRAVDGEIQPGIRLPGGGLTSLRLASAAAPQHMLSPRNPPFICRHVLLAEDNRANRIYIETLLIRMGHKVQSVNNGRDAIAAVRGGNFDCVLMDMQMPVMSGIAATRAIRALPAPAGMVAILGLSAEDSPATRKLARAAGLTSFLRKPVDEGILAHWLVSLSAEAIPETVAPVVPVSAPVLDFHQLEALETALPETSLVNLISMFLSDAAKYLHQIEVARQAGDLASSGRLAHQLVSMAGNLGAMEMSMLSRRFELACQNGDAGQADLLARALSSASAKATAALAARHKCAPKAVARQSGR